MNLETWRYPIELDEKHDGPKLNLVDVLELHRALIEPDWFETFANVGNLGLYGSNEYPTPRTVRMRCGLSRSGSIFSRIRRTCSVTVAGSCHSNADDHTRSRSCAREYTRRGDAARNSEQFELPRRQSRPRGLRP